MQFSNTTKNRLFKAGYVTKGLLYLLIGGFAVATVVGAARNTNGPKAIIDWLGNNPFGQAFTILVGVGLASYAVWRWYTAIGDPASAENDTKGIVKRIGWAVSGTTYGLLAVYAFKSLNGSGGNSGGKKDMVGLLLEQPYGQELVGIVAAVVVGVGAYQLYRAFTDKHMDGINKQQISQEQEDSFRTTGRIGLTARCVVYGIIAYFLFRAATLSDASQFRGIGEALGTLQGGDLGSALLAVTGVGMLAYGFFMLVRARYERV
ncbi:DUF1206 domain-containing protein [Neolewinella persica]|uniref:DUF1206 domain-containing protein n=1 Tax=Neolewinella persica TaxID=70998 RepID=UPI0003728149|nr:DUF1206 domain-containing protein [Neolewinella persica]